MSRIVIVTSDIVPHRVAAWALENIGHEVIFVGADDAESLVLDAQPRLLIVDTDLPTANKADLIARLRVASSGSRVMEIVDGAKPTTKADSTFPVPYTIDNFAEEATRLIDGHSG